MGFFDFLHRKHEDAMIEVFIEEQAKELKIKELMIEHAIDLIAKTIAKSDIQVFRNKDNKIIKSIDDVYYRLNVRPNPNEDGTTFIYSVVAKLLREGEALIVRMENSDLFLADRWETDDQIINGKRYYNIVISDNDLREYKLNKVVTADDAVYMSLGDNKINDVLNDFYQGYADMISASVNGFKKSNYRKYKLLLPTQTQAIKNAETGEEISLKEYVEKIAGDLLQENDSITALSKQFDLEQIGKDTVRESKDTREMINEFGNKVAMAFNIPLDVYYGSKTDKSTATNDFITFAVMPILSILEDALNAKLIEKESYLLGEKIQFDKFTMKHFDIMDVAHSLDKLFAIGWSHNDLQEIMGQPIVEEEWANRHHVTKNYMDVDDPALKGGE